jgi:hypothetical protein
MKKLFFPLLFFCGALHAQQIAPSVINATGSSAVLNNVTVEIWFSSVWDKLN